MNGTDAGTGAAAIVERTTHHDVVAGGGEPSGQHGDAGRPHSVVVGDEDAHVIEATAHAPSNERR